MKTDTTTCVEIWDSRSRNDMPEGVYIKLRVEGSLELTADIAAAIEGILDEKGAGTDA